MESVNQLQTKLLQNGYVLVKTTGTSMRPLIWTGQHCVAIVPLESEPKIGDLLAFMHKVGNKERGVIHRLVEIRSEAGETIYITRGDNCIGTETLIRTQIIGKVAEIHRLTGYRPWHIIPRKIIKVTDRSYLMYTRFWTAIWPVRRILYRLFNRIGSLRRK